MKAGHLMDIKPLLAVLLQVVSVGFAVWLCLPDVLYLLGLTRIRRGIESGPEEVSLDQVQGVPEEMALELNQLGYTFAGVYWENLPAHKTFREFVFVSKKGDGYASVYRLWYNDPPRVAFLTMFASGAIVFTQNYQGGMEANEDTLRAGGLPNQATPAVESPAERLFRPPAPPPRETQERIVLGISFGVGLYLSVSHQFEYAFPLSVLVGVVIAALLHKLTAPRPETPPAVVPMAEIRRSPEETWQEHQHRLLRFRQLGNVVAPSRTLEDYLHAEDHYHAHPTVIREFRGALMVILPFKLGFLALGPTPGAMIFGIVHPVPWILLLVECLVMVHFRYFGLPIVASLEKQAGFPSQH